MRCVTICPTSRTTTAAVLAISVGPAPTHKVWAAQSGFLFPVLSDFWPHGAVSQAYGVFNDDAGVSNRGTFVIDRSGTDSVRRDETAWRGP